MSILWKRFSHAVINARKTFAQKCSLQLKQMFIYLVAWSVLTCVLLLLFLKFETTAKEDSKGKSPDITLKVWSVRQGSHAAVVLSYAHTVRVFPFASHHNRQYDTNIIYVLFELVKHHEALTDGAHLTIFPSETLPRQEGILFNMSLIEAFRLTTLTEALLFRLCLWRHADILSTDTRITN